MTTPYTRDDLLLTLRQIAAALNQPVQHTKTGDGVAAILRADANLARMLALDAIKAEYSHEVRS